MLRGSFTVSIFFKRVVVYFDLVEQQFFSLSFTLAIHAVGKQIFKKWKNKLILPQKFIEPHVIQ